MRRFTSFLLAGAMFFTSVAPCASAEPARIAGSRSMDHPAAGELAPPALERNRMGMLTWGGLFLLNSVLLSVGISDLRENRDAGLDAEARGENPDEYWDSYDRAGWIVAGAGVGLVASSIGFLSSMRLRPADAERPRPASPPPQEKKPPPAEPKDPPAKPVITPPVVARDASADPVTNVIGALHEKDAARNAPKQEPPVVTQRVRTQQAWLPGTKVETPRDSTPPVVPAPVAARADSGSAPPAAVAGADSQSTEQRTAVITQRVKVTAGRIADAAPDTTTAPVLASRDTIVATVPRLVVTLPAPDDSIPSEPATPPAPERTAPPAAPRTARPDTAVVRAVAPPRSTAPDTSAARAPAAGPKRYTLHVGSHKARANADAEAARWGLVGHKAFVLDKDLGEKGIWHRVMIGDFTSSGEADRFASEFTTAFPGQYALVVRRD